MVNSLKVRMDADGASWKTLASAQLSATQFYSFAGCSILGGS